MIHSVVSGIFSAVIRYKIKSLCRKTKWAFELRIVYAFHSTSCDASELLFVVFFFYYFLNFKNTKVGNVQQQKKKKSYNYGWKRNGEI